MTRSRVKGASGLGEQPTARSKAVAKPGSGRNASTAGDRTHESPPRRAELPGGRERQILASKVTSRSQTTLPSGVRKALGLRGGDSITYVIEKDRVTIRKRMDEEDPALAGFLDLLETDVARNKAGVVFATDSFAAYLADLTAGIPVDYDAPIEGDFQL
jgi:antitoxin PrlF